HGAREPPGTGLGVGPALRPVGSRERGDGELRMLLEQLQEALPDRTRRPEDTEPSRPHRCSLTHRTPAASIEHTHNRSARGALPRIAATLNKVLKSDRPRRGIAPGFSVFRETRTANASERNRARARLDGQPGGRLRLRGRRRPALAPPDR